MRRTILILALLAACAPEGEREQTEDAEQPDAPATALGGDAVVTDPRDIGFAPELDVDLDGMQLKPSGLYIQVLEEGAGPPAAAGDRMGVDYTVWLPDGSKLDSSFDHEPPAPLTMVLGQTRLIDGWTEGVTGMRRGEKRRLVVPYDLAYGARGRPPQVPPYTALVFELELVEHEPGS